MHHTLAHTQVPREGCRHFISYASRGRQSCGGIQRIVSYLIREAAHTHTKSHTDIKALLPCSQLLRGGIRVEMQRDAERGKGNRWILPLRKLVMLVTDTQHSLSHLLGISVWRDVTVTSLACQGLISVCYCENLYRTSILEDKRDQTKQKKIDRLLQFSFLQGISEQCSFVTHHSIHLLIASEYLHLNWWGHLSTMPERLVQIWCCWHSKYHECIFFFFISDIYRWQHFFAPLTAVHGWWLNQTANSKPSASSTNMELMNNFMSFALPTNIFQFNRPLKT